MARTRLSHTRKALLKRTPHTRSHYAVRTGVSSSQYPLSHTVHGYSHESLLHTACIQALAVHALPHSTSAALGPSWCCRGSTSVTARSALTATQAPAQHARPWHEQQLRHNMAWHGAQQLVRAEPSCFKACKSFPTLNVYLGIDLGIAGHTLRHPLCTLARAALNDVSQGTLHVMSCHVMHWCVCSMLQLCMCSAPLSLPRLLLHPDFTNNSTPALSNSC